MGSLEASYANACVDEGWRVSLIDIYEIINRHSRFGYFGKLASNVSPVEPWVRRANREVVIAAGELAPSVILVCGTAQVRAGALAQIKINNPMKKLVLLWPDPMLNLQRHVLEALCVYDLVCSFSLASVDVIRRLGGNCEWVPFGADLHYCDTAKGVNGEEEASQYLCDVGFVGNHRAEREELFRMLVENNVDVKVWGPRQWIMDARWKKSVWTYWQKRMLHGRELSRVLARSRVCINPIDATTKGAANMRFFEILMSGGVALNTKCHEMEADFPEGEAAYYYESPREALDKVRYIIANPSEARRVANTGRRAVIAAHTYRHRWRFICGVLSRSS